MQMMPTLELSTDASKVLRGIEALIKDICELKRLPIQGPRQQTQPGTAGLEQTSWGAASTEGQVLDTGAAEQWQCHSRSLVSCFLLVFVQGSIKSEIRPWPPHPKPLQGALMEASKVL